MQNDNNRVPLVIYGPDGEKKIVGEAEIGEGEILSHVTDHDVWEMLTGNLADHLSIGEDVAAGPKAPHSMSFKTFVRRPFTIEAVEVTEENWDQVANMTGIKRAKVDGTPFIETNRDIVPNVYRIYLGFWLTSMNGKLRAYSAKTFNDMFMEGMVL